MGVKVRKIRKKADGSPVWGLRIDHAGQRKTVTVGSKRAAEAARVKVEASLAAGALEIKPSAPPFLELAQEWLELIKASRSTSTYERYEGILRLHMQEINAPINKITRGQLRNFLLKLWKKGTSKSSIENIYSVISGVFRYAYDDEIIDKNPSRLLLKQLNFDEDRKEINPFSKEEFSNILKLCKSPYKDFFLVAYHTGARLGELSALEWSDIDFKARKISITKSIRRQEVSKTKTKTSRTIEMNKTLTDHLLKMKEKAVYKRVFEIKEGKIIAPQSLRDNLKRCCRALGIKERTVHDIRHTTASTLLSRGANIVYVSKLLGHSTVSMTLDKYCHFMPSESCHDVDLLV